MESRRAAHIKRCVNEGNNVISADNFMKALEAIMQNVNVYATSIKVSIVLFVVKTSKLKSL